MKYYLIREDKIPKNPHKRHYTRQCPTQKEIEDKVKSDIWEECLKSILNNAVEYDLQAEQKRILEEIERNFIVVGEIYALLNHDWQSLKRRILRKR